MRYWHVISPVKATPFPARIVGLAVKTERVESPTNPRAAREELRLWAASGWHLGKVGPGANWGKIGTTREEWFSTLQGAAKMSGETWIVSKPAARVWAALGLWEMVENGKVNLGRSHPCGSVYDNRSNLLHGMRHRTAHVGTDRSRDRIGTVSEVRRGNRALPAGRASNADSKHGKPALVVLEDPPSILTVSLPGLPGRLTFLDLRNFGIDDCCEEDRPFACATWIQATMARMVGLIRAEKLGGLMSTAAAQAMHTWRYAALTESVLVHNHKPTLQLESTSYFGGRCECRQLGPVEEEVVHLDYRNLYPSIARNGALPSALRIERAPDEAPTIESVGDGSDTIAEVSLQTASPDYPCRFRGMVVFPTGRFRTALCGPELTDALAKGRVKRVHSFARYHMTTCLRAYVDKLYPLLERARADYDVPLQQWLKRLLVCLPGKLGQRGRTWEDRPLYRCPAPWVEWVHLDSQGDGKRCRSIGWHVQEEQPDGWGRESVPAVAAWVCSAGRMALLSAIRQARWEEIYYYDTDSLFCTPVGLANLESAGMVGRGEMGALRVIGRYSKVHFYGLKHYVADGVRTCAGLPKGTQSASQYTDSYWYQLWLKSAVRQGKRPDASLTLKGYTANPVYHTGVVCEDRSIAPLYLEEW